MGRGNAFFVHGTCPVDAGVSGLALRAGEAEHPVTTRFPARTRRSEVEWWATVPVEPVEAQRGLPLSLRAEGGVDARLADVELEPGDSEGGAPGGASLAICMATYNPPPDLFERQISSIRSQTHRDWICAISDDASDAERLDAMQSVIGDDDRFRLHTHERRLGFYGNFERALSLAPRDADHIALSDQDDAWHPEKLESLLAAIGERATLAYADMRVVDRRGEVLLPTYWSHRGPNHTDLATLLLGNTITGAAALFRRDLLERLLPFPPPLGRSFHDHWLAVVALGAGGIAYVDRPLHDYVQHPGSVIGYAAARGGRDPAAGAIGSALARLRRLGARAARPRARDRYFADYCRIRLMARVLELRCGDSMGPEKADAVRRVIELESSARSLRWLAGRSARAAFGRNETLGVDRSVLAGVLWSRLGHGLDREPRDRQP